MQPNKKNGNELVRERKRWSEKNERGRWEYLGLSLSYEQEFSRKKYEMKKIRIVLSESDSQKKKLCVSSKYISPIYFL